MGGGRKVKGDEAEGREEKVGWGQKIKVVTRGIGRQR